jgi:hypothetical protein
VTDLTFNEFVVLVEEGCYCFSTGAKKEKGFVHIVEISQNPKQLKIKIWAPSTNAAFVIIDESYTYFRHGLNVIAYKKNCSDAFIFYSLKETRAFFTDELSGFPNANLAREEDRMLLVL